MDNSHMIRVIEVRLKEMGITKKQFYSDTGISSATYSQWNTGQFSPSKRKLEAISKYIGVPVSKLTGEEQKENPSAQGGGEMSKNKRLLMDLIDRLPDEALPKARRILEEIFSSE